MRKKTLWLAETAMLLALLIVCQTVSKPAGQIVTGTLVNMVLGIATFLVGTGSGAVIALVSPVAAFLLGIAPQILTVPAIMAGNLALVCVLGLKMSDNFLGRLVRCLGAAAAKFLVLYGLVVWGICYLLAEKLLENGLLKQPMISVLTATFTWPQLITALLGSLIATGIAAALKRAIHRF